MKTRNFAGYVKDRVTGSADFDKEDKAKTASAKPILGGANPNNKAALEAAGYKKGGMVKSKKSCW